MSIALTIFIVATALLGLACIFLARDSAEMHKDNKRLRKALRKASDKAIDYDRRWAVFPSSKRVIVASSGFDIIAKCWEVPKGDTATREYLIRCAEELCEHLNDNPIITEK